MASILFELDIFGGKKSKNSNCSADKSSMLVDRASLPMARNQRSDSLRSNSLAGRRPYVELTGKFGLRYRCNFSGYCLPLTTGRGTLSYLVHRVHPSEVVQDKISDASANGGRPIPFSSGVNLYRRFFGDLAGVRNMHVGLAQQQARCTG